jgi:hypothetical protein
MTTSHLEAQSDNHRALRIVLDGKFEVDQKAADPAKVTDDLKLVAPVLDAEQRMTGLTVMA